MDELLFTPAGLLDLLSQIDELSDKDLNINESPAGVVTLAVGTSSYIIKDTNVTEIEVEPEVLDTVNDVNIDALEDLEDSGELDVSDDVDVEGSIIKEAAKTLLVGGLVRLTSKLLGNKPDPKTIRR